ncbi:hypothetical protein [Halosimplex halophilum]|uniref:hypothetical protein n=1 Tax=Halosimplex halophilum TaxID=2559572 RepID=UPI00107F986C|nr:hypothetical protein [Halosimplex halophilum]
MDAEDYLKKQESRLVTIEVDQTKPVPPYTGSGKIVCSDSRLVFDTAQSITDIRLDSISEIDYSPPSYLNGLTRYGMLAIIAGAILWLLLSVISQIPSGTEMVAFLPISIGVVLVILGILFAKASLVIKTDQSTYRFRGDDSEISKLPHAIRGASAN